MRWLMMLLVFAQSAHSTVLIQAPASSSLDYRASLQADEELISPSHYILKQRPRSTQRESLLAAFAAAQQAYLENSKEQAIGKFQNLVQQVTSDDWAQSDRLVFLHSFLRLAQLEIEVTKQNYWLTRALLVGDDVEPESGLFPPPLLRTLKNLKREVPRATVPAVWWQEGWNMILLNGVSCTRQNCKGWPQVPEPVRVTFLSDMWQPFTAEVESSELKNLKPKKIAWATGDCGHTQLGEPARALKDPQVFWGLSCDSQKPAVALNLNPVATTDPLPRLAIQEKSPAFYKSKWFWAGAGVIAAALIIAGSKQQKDEKEPTTTYGHQ